MVAVFMVVLCAISLVAFLAAPEGKDRAMGDPGPAPARER